MSSHCFVVILSKLNLLNRHSIFHNQDYCLKAIDSKYRDCMVLIVVTAQFAISIRSSFFNRVFCNPVIMFPDIS